MTDNGNISYPIRDLLRDINDKLDAITDKLDGMDRRLTIVETQENNRIANWKLWVPIVALGVIDIGAIVLKH